VKGHALAGYARLGAGQVHVLRGIAIRYRISAERRGHQQAQAGGETNELLAFPVSSHRLS
jgi:hypothetical protein